jgi:hypothetical protein
MAIIFPNPATQSPTNTFSPTSVPPNTTNSLTYIYDPALGVWTSAAGGGGGGGVASVGVTAPITDTGTATAPNIGISPASTTAAGSLSAADKIKIDALPATIVSAVTGTAPIQIGGTASIPNVTLDAATGAAPGAVELATAAEAAAGIDADRAMTPSVSVPKALLDMTGAAIIPGGDDTQRAAITSPVDGMLRYNDTTAPSVMEYYDGSNWVDLAVAGGASNPVWTQVATTPAFQSMGIAYGNGAFVAVGAQNGGPTNAIVSSDGYTWSSPASITGAGTGGSTQLVFSGGRFVLIANGGTQSFTSLDGASWTQGAVVAGGLAGVGPGLVASGSNYVSGNSANVVYYSADGLNWSVATFASALSGSLRSIAPVTGSTFMLVEGVGTGPWNVWTSTDGGANWTNSGVFITASAGMQKKGASDGTYGYFSVTGSSTGTGIFRTPDGSTFTRISGQSSPDVFGFPGGILTPNGLTTDGLMTLNVYYSPLSGSNCAYDGVDTIVGSGIGVVNVGKF